MEKIIINKNDSIKAVIKKIENSESDGIILVVPRQSAFGEEVSHFDMLREAATELEKEVAIESVDENVLALAKVNDFAAIHPLFEGSAGKMSDIVPGKSHKKLKIGHESSAGKSKEKRPVMSHEVEEAADEKVLTAEPTETEELVAAEHGVDYGQYEEEEKPRRNIKGKVFGAIGILAVFAVVYFAGIALGGAKVVILLKKTPWTDSASLSASKAATKVNPDTATIPAQVFAQTKTITQLFPASGKSQVSQKAKGKIVIYNAYSSQQQQLVATTRFQTPDGKILRLVSSITVPGAKIVDNKVVPSTMTADVIADQPGEQYNVGPLDKLLIPGFKSSPKYDGFYGVLMEQLTGGFVGVRPVPTDSDIVAAKQKATDVLKSAFGPSFFQNVPQDFKMLDGASNLEITKLAVDTNTDNSGNFSILGEAKFTAVGFREGDLKAYLLTRAQKVDASADFNKIDLTYSKLRADLKNGIISFVVDSNAVLSPSFNQDSFRDSILGKPSDTAKSMILGINELSSGSLSLSPFWLTSVPTSASKVNIQVQ